MSKAWWQRMEEARKQAGLSAAALARGVGVSTATMSEWRNGYVAEPRAGDFMQLCEMLRVTPRWLWFGRGRPSGEGRETPGTLAALWERLTPRQRARLLAQMQQYADDNAEVLRDTCPGEHP